MMTPEEKKVLAFLQRHKSTTADALARSCLRGTPGAWVSRVVANLDWLGYLTVFHGPDGEPAALCITDKGMGVRAAVPALS